MKWSVQRERIHEVWTEAWPLLQAHYAEIAHFRDIPLNPDFAAYEMAEEAGMLRVYTLRSAEGLPARRLHGYQAFFVRRNLHYCSSLQASQDVLYLDEKVRGGITATRFMRFCEAQLSAEGVQVVMQHVKVATPRTLEWMQRLGYVPVDCVLARRLDGDVRGLRDRRRAGGAGADAESAERGRTDAPADADGRG